MPSSGEGGAEAAVAGHTANRGLRTALTAPEEAHQADTTLEAATKTTIMIMTTEYTDTVVCTDPLTITAGTITAETITKEDDTKPPCQEASGSTRDTATDMETDSPDTMTRVWVAALSEVLEEGLGLGLDLNLEAQDLEETLEEKSTGISIVTTADTTMEDTAAGLAGPAALLAVVNQAGDKRKMTR